MHKLNLNLCYSIIVFYLLYYIAIDCCYSAASENSGTVFKFGEVVQGEIIKHTFQIENDTPDTMVISRVKTSCGCRAATFPKYKIEPGETLNFEVAVDTRNQKGFVLNKFEIFLGPPHNKVLRYFLKVHVRVPWECVPTSVNFGLVSSAKGIHQKLRIENHSDNLLKILKIECVPSDFDVELSKNSVEKDAHINLIISPHESIPAGCYEGHIKIITNHPIKKEIEIPIYLRLSGPVQAIPEVVLLGIIHKRTTRMDERERKVIIRSSVGQGPQFP